MAWSSEKIVFSKSEKIVRKYGSDDPKKTNITFKNLCRRTHVRTSGVITIPHPAETPRANYISALSPDLHISRTLKSLYLGVPCGIKNYRFFQATCDMLRLRKCQFALYLAYFRQSSCNRILIVQHICTKCMVSFAKLCLALPCKESNAF